MIEVIEPATGKVMAEVEQADVERTDAAVARAKEAFPAWRDVTPGVCRWVPTCSMCWSSVPPQATLSICMPRQMPSTGMSRSSAARASAASKRSRCSFVPLVSG